MLGLGTTAGRRVMLVAASGLLVAACSSSGGHAAAPTTTAHHGSLLSCSDGGPTFPPSALRSSPTADQGDGELAVALREALTLPMFPTPAPHGWRMLYDTGAMAGFLSEPSDSAPNGVFVELRKTKGSWHFLDSGVCDREVTHSGLARATWAVDPVYGFPKAADTTVHIVVQDSECNDGLPLTRDRIHPPVVGWATRTVTVAMYVTPVSPGMHKCPAPLAPSGQTGIGGIAAVAYPVDLGRPLGPRQLLDGSIYPPRPPDVGTR